MWSYSNWGSCSVTCGTGRMTRTAMCKIGYRVVDDNQCNRSSKESLSKSCSSQCAEWVADGWSECSTSCGGGKRTRLYCCELNGSKVSDWLCDSSLKPYSSEECNLHECPRWSIGSWKACSATCNGGYKKRYLYTEPTEY